MGQSGSQLWENTGYGHCGPGRAGIGVYLQRPAARGDAKQAQVEAPGILSADVETVATCSPR